VLLHTQGDKTVPVQNSILYYQAAHPRRRAG
jgi:predicted peptidase